MTNKNDVLGTFALAEQLEALRSVLMDVLESKDPFSELVPEKEFSKKVGVPASTLRAWRSDGTLQDSWIKKGKHIFWSPRKFREELQKSA